MIVRKIAVENWKRFIEPVEFEFEEGVNILHGPNEAGKTTVLEAITRAFFARHNSSTQEIKAIQPLGTKLAPRVSVEFTHQGTDFLITKTFLQNAASKLSIRPDGTWRQQADGDEADRLLREVLSGPDSNRRTLTPAERGLAEALWSLQGEAPLPAESWGDPIKSGLGDLVDVAAFTELDQRFLNRVAKLFEDLYQQRRMGFRVGSEPQKALDDCQEAHAALESLLELERAADQLVSVISQDESDLGQAELQVASAESEQALAKEGCEGADKYEIEKLESDRQVSDDKEKLGSIEQDLSTYENLQLDIGLLRSDQARLLASLAGLRAQHEAASTEKERLMKERTEVLLPAIEQAELRKGALEAAQRKRKLEKELADLEKHQSQIEKLEEDLRSMSAAISTLGAPDETTMASYLSLVQEWTTVKMELRAVGARVSLSDGLSVKTDLPLDDDGSFHVAGAVTFAISKHGSFTVETLAADARDLSARDRSLQKRISAIHSQFKVSSHDELQVLSSNRAQLEGQQASTESTLQLIRRQRPDATELSITVRQGVQDETVLAAEVADEVDGWGGGQLREVTQEVATEIQRLRLRAESIVTDCASLDTKLSGLREAMSGDETAAGTAKGQITQAESQQTTLLGKYGTLAILKVARKSAAEKLSLTEANHASVEAMYEERVTRPREKLNLAQTAVRTSQQRLQELRLRVTALRGQLQGMGIMGLTERVEEAETKRDKLERIKDRAIARAGAIKALHEASERVHNDHVRAVARPIATIVDAWLPRINPRFKSMELNENLIPEKLQTSSFEDGVPTGFLSFGTQEQIALLVRLALAWHLSESERQLVVLDDRLVNADAERRRAMCGIVDQVARERCQVILSTCNVEDYDALSGNRLDVVRLARSLT